MATRMTHAKRQESPQMASETNRNEKLSPDEIAERVRAELAMALVFTEGPTSRSRTDRRR